MRRSGANATVGHGGDIEMESLGDAKLSAHLQPVHLAEEATRAGFVRKVYGILATQLVVTAVLAGLITLHGRAWLKSSPAMVLGVVTLSSAVSLMLAVVFACCPETMRHSPTNYVLLVVFTLAESVLVGVASLQYTLGSVVLCFGLTAVAVTALTVYALTTKTDMTSAGPYMLCALAVLCGTGILLSLSASLGFAHNPMFDFLQVVYAAGGALIFSAFIVYDTQLITGGNHQQHTFCIDDYAMAAICLYLDIIQLFLALLRLLGQKDDNGI